MAEVRIMFTGIINVVPTQQGAHRRIVVPDLRHHGMHPHLPAMVVDRPHDSHGLVSLFESGDTQTFLLDGLAASVGPEGRIEETAALGKYLLPVAKGCPAPYAQCGRFSDAGKTDYVSLDLTLLSGVLDACWIDREYQWSFSPSRQVGYLAEEICLTFEAPSPLRIDFTRIEKSSAWQTEHEAEDVAPASNPWIELRDESGDGLEIRIVNISPESRFLGPARGQSDVDPHVMMYYDWSSIGVPAMARRPLVGHFDPAGNLQPDHEHRLNGLAEIPILKLHRPGGMNCPPGGWNEG